MQRRKIEKLVYSAGFNTPPQLKDRRFDLGRFDQADTEEADGGLPRFRQGEMSITFVQLHLNMLEFNRVLSLSRF